MNENDLSKETLFALVVQYKNIIEQQADCIAELEKEKTLTDEEIIKTMVQFDVYSADDKCLIEAARAILKKASEK